VEMCVFLACWWGGVIIVVMVHRQGFLVPRPNQAGTARLRCANFSCVPFLLSPSSFSSLLFSSLSIYPVVCLAPPIYLSLRP
jgi:hypothetical protein